MNAELARHEGLIAGGETQIAAHQTHLVALRRDLENARRRLAAGVHNHIDLIGHRHQERQLAGEVKRFETLISEAKREIGAHHAHVARLRACEGTTLRHG